MAFFDFTTTDRGKQVVPFFSLYLTVPNVKKNQKHDGDRYSN